ncbi:MAG TPA: TadE/TadG family type IV pilus assembly protein [Acidimicrobiales bacterium]|nr:TadE/TadG family type IV pilus assembly protein [Acidimicrobiales bacterium]
MRRDAQGGLTVELVLLAPVLILFALMALGLGRYELARQELADAARAGAEAASVVPSADQAAGAASSAVLAPLNGQSHMCAHPAVTTDSSGFAAGGDVRVTVSCRVDLSDLLVPGLPGGVDVSATQVAPVDPFREVS